MSTYDLTVAPYRQANTDSGIETKLGWNYRKFLGSELKTLKDGTSTSNGDVFKIAKIPFGSLIRKVVTIVTDADDTALTLWRSSLRTLRSNIQDFDTGFWSLYEQSGTFLKMIASPFYHRLHIVQLKVLWRITGEDFFKDYAKKWEKYAENPFYRLYSLFYKLIFKILYY